MTFGRPRASPTPALAVRLLMRAARKAALATAMSPAYMDRGPMDRSENPGAPYASLVTTATAPDGAPLLLLSTLADHTRNLRTAPQACLLFEDETGRGINPQQRARASVMGRIAPHDEPSALARFLARHPYAARYAGFKDFSLYRMDVTRAHYVGGFARAVWVKDAILGDPRAAETLAKAEAGIIARMNADHAETLALYANRLLRLRGRHWRMTALDMDGIDLTLGKRVARLAFPAPARNAQEVETALSVLAEKARNP